MLHCLSSLATLGVATDQRPQSLCPAGCNGHGFCDDSTCVCHPGCAGPPAQIRLPAAFRCRHPHSSPASIARRFWFRTSIFCVSIMLVSVYVPSQISWIWYIRAIHDSKNATTRVRVDPKQGQKEYFTAKRLTFDELILELLVYFAAIGVDGMECKSIGGSNPRPAEQ